jgi:hypothetical protein
MRAAPRRHQFPSPAHALLPHLPLPLPLVPARLPRSPPPACLSARPARSLALAGPAPGPRARAGRRWPLLERAGPSCWLAHLGPVLSRPIPRPAGGPPSLKPARFCPLARDAPSRLAQACSPRSLRRRYPMDDVGLSAALRPRRWRPSPPSLRPIGRQPPPAAAASPNRAEAPPAALVGRFAQAPAGRGAELNETHLLCIMYAQCLQKVCKAQNQCA